MALNIDFKTLDSRIQYLAQELQDMILDSLLSMPLQANTATINGSYKPPLALHLSQNLRAEFAPKFYGGVAFDVEAPLEPTWEGGIETNNFKFWVDGLDPAHRSLLKTVKFTLSYAVGLRGEEHVSAGYLRHELDFGPRMCWSPAKIRRWKLPHVMILLNFMVRAGDGVMWEEKTVAVKGGQDFDEDDPNAVLMMETVSTRTIAQDVAQEIEEDLKERTKPSRARWDVIFRNT